MKSSALPPDIARQEQAIESKQALLAYLRSKPKRLTMESYLCLTELLRKANWEHKDQLWQKSGLQLPIIVAAVMELERQILADKDRILRKTVNNYGDSARRVEGEIARHMHERSGVVFLP